MEKSHPSPPAGGAALASSAVLASGFERGAPRSDPLLRASGEQAILETRQGAWGHGTAIFDVGRRYRFRLSRVWDATKPRICFVLLNPSTADAARLDPTVRRCAGFARGWGAGALEITNLFALRATDPRDLRAAPEPIGEGNDEAILAGALAADLVVCGWGIHGALRQRHRAVLTTLTAAGVEPLALGLTKGGHPRHPLYLRRDLWPTPILGSGDVTRLGTQAPCRLSS
jgi:hypothetical protein